MTQIFKFYKEADGSWYIDLPGWTGSKAELEMVQGADTMLDIVSGHTNECFLRISDEQFESAEVLVLEKARIPNHGGGGDYILETYEGETILHRMWLCVVTEYVFKGLPQNIYFKRV